MLTHSRPEGNRDIDSLSFIETKYSSLITGDPILKQRNERFITRVKEIYKGNGQSKYIERAMILTTVAHQLNENTEKRHRKEKDTENNPIPYYFHPLEMAERIVGLMRPGDIPLDWITVVATLLHDVPEDVTLGGITGKDPWLTHIRGLFFDTGKQDLIADIIDGVTKRELELIDYHDGNGKKPDEGILKSPLYKMFIGFARQGGVYKSHNTPIEKKLSLQDKNEIVEVITNLEFLIKSAIKSPEHLRIFLVKILDYWSNSKTSQHIKDNKKLRANIEISLAYFLGWDSMVYDLVINTAKMIDLNSPFFSTIGDAPREFNLREKNSCDS